MKTTTLLVVLIGIVIGFFGFLYMNNLVGAWLDGAKNLATLIYTQWMQIPSMVRNIVLMGIPTLFAMFFAWSKIRAMEKLRQTEVQASQQIIQTQGEYQEKIDALTQQNNALKSQAGEGVTSLASQLTEAQTTLQKREKEIETLNSKLHEAEALAHVNMHPTEADMIATLRKAGYTITETVS